MHRAFLASILLIFTITVMTAKSMKVAVIGAGGAGLAAARVLVRNGIIPVVLEKEECAGGVWDYRDSANDRPMYRGLRTNLPREIMAFREFPWTNEINANGKSYVTHHDVLKYLNVYKNKFDLDRFIQYGSNVKQLMVSDGSNPSIVKDNGGEQSLPKITLEWEDANKQIQSEAFDAVCVANGHYAAPSFPQLEGLDNFSGQTMHSITYDSPESFKGQVVLCIGGRASGSDLAREISHCAKHVYLSDTTQEKQETQDNVTCVPKTIAIGKDGSIYFDRQCPLTPKVDTIIFCSGYDYRFPFINDKSGLDLSVVPGERRVSPLYRHLWHADCPNLSFVGLPHSVIPFPLFEFQVEAVVKQLLDNHNSLPDQKERRVDAELDATAGGSKKTGRIQDTHYLGSAQWEYSLDMARIAGLMSTSIENFVKTNEVIYEHSGSIRKGIFPAAADSYREYVYKRNDAKQAFQILSQPFANVN